MAKKSLIETNPYLKDPEKRKAMFYTTVSSSTAIEGVHVAVKEAIKAIDALGGKTSIRSINSAGATSLKSRR
jgi:hypothetical protein